MPVSSGGFITAIVVNPPERKLAKRTSVHCRAFNFYNPHLIHFYLKYINLDHFFFKLCVCAPLILLLLNLSLWVCYSKGHPVFKQTIPKDRVKGSCLLSEMIPLQLVGKVPGKDIPIVLWDNKVSVIEYIRLQSFILYFVNN